jgi:hypothetical protein
MGQLNVRDYFREDDRARRLARAVVEGRGEEFVRLVLEADRLSAEERLAIAYFWLNALPGREAG